MTNGAQGMRNEHEQEASGVRDAARDAVRGTSVPQTSSKDTLHTLLLYCST